MFSPMHVVVFLYSGLNVVLFITDGKRDSVLYIAMAGTHQIWVYFLQDSAWYKHKFVLLSHSTLPKPKLYCSKKSAMV